MINIAICDDNEIQRELLTDQITAYGEEHPGIECRSFAGGEELLRYVEENGPFAIYLLDVLMPGRNGMETAAALRQRKDEGRIIFITASADYAVSSYDVDATYYLLKPVDPEKLYRILDRVTAELRREEKTITVRLRTARQDDTLNISDITCVELNNRVPVYHLQDGSAPEGTALRGAFRELMAPLLEHPEFCACGASLVVNFDYVESMDGEAIQMKDGTELYPPRSAWGALHKAWQEYCRRA